ncbi:MAG TPA: hypothetical protein VM425_06470 [Myxococcota bacterium]|nr:hypothetical protein [Myxococcota bacterium]
MKGRKLEARGNRLNLVKAQAEARKKVLKEKGLDEEFIKKDSMMRHLLAEARKVKRSIESRQREPLKVEQVKKPAKEAARPKAPKPPREKKPKKEEEAPPG